jgi:hypothetical protein
MSPDGGASPGGDDRASDAVPPRASPLFDRSFWESVAAESPELAGDPEGTEHLVYRFLGKYLPAVLKARTAEGRERAWLALWSYMIARRSARKPFGLSPLAADELVGRFQAELVQQGYGPK